MVARAGSTDQDQASAALAWLVERYWDPLRRLARRWLRNDAAADDALQDFFCRLVERRTDLAILESGRGPFRSWILTVYRNFLFDRIAHDQTAKRGGGRLIQGIDSIEPPGCSGPDLEYERDWAETVLGRSIDRLAAEQVSDEERRRFATLRVFLVANGSSEAYIAAGTTLGLSEGAVKVAVHRLRQSLRDMARLEIIDTLDEPSQSEVDQELETLAQALMSRSR